jgi:hypothetical protein
LSEKWRFLVFLRAKNWRFQGILALKTLYFDRFWAFLKDG